MFFYKLIQRFKGWICGLHEELKFIARHNFKYVEKLNRIS